MTVTNIPTEEDFYTSGKELLDFSWDLVARLLTDIDEAEYFGVDPEEISDNYWAAAKRRLTTSLSITQQGVEFILKGRIAAISPFLLITNAPAKWPSPYQGKPINFSEFRTVDAQDLIRVLDTFSSSPLPDEFVEQFHELRKKRNHIMHSVDKQLTVDVAEVIGSLLFVHKTLFPHESWISVRLNFLDQAPDSELGAQDFSRNRVCWEAKLVINLLSPSKVKKYFRIDKKQSRYLCPECLSQANRDAGFEHKLGVLQPKGATTDQLYCPVCDLTHSVLREYCEKLGCSGNVLSQEGECLTCSS